MCMDGVFSLPVRMTVQRCEFWEERSVSGEERSMEQQGREILHAALAESLAEEERIVSEHYASQTGNDAVTVTVMAECLEELGVEEPISQGELREIRTQREEAVND